MVHFGLAQDDILELVRLIYGLTDAGEYWGVTLDHLAQEELGIVPLLRDL